MTNNKSGLGVIGSAAIMMFLAACASKPPEDVSLTGSIQTVADVNPDALGRPSPLQIKVFQLAATEKFEQADYFELADAGEATLGADLLGVQAVMMAPGETRPYEGEFDPQTRFIGVIAGYRDIHQAKWRAIAPMPEKSVMKLMRRGGVKITADRLAISISAGE